MRSQGLPRRCARSQRTGRGRSTRARSPPASQPARGSRRRISPPTKRSGSTPVVDRLPGHHRPRAPTAEPGRERPARPRACSPRRSTKAIRRASAPPGRGGQARVRGDAGASPMAPRRRRCCSPTSCIAALRARLGPHAGPVARTTPRGAVGHDLPGVRRRRRPRCLLHPEPREAVRLRDRRRRAPASCSTTGRRASRSSPVIRTRSARAGDRSTLSSPACCSGPAAPRSRRSASWAVRCSRRATYRSIDAMVRRGRDPQAALDAPRFMVQDDGTWRWSPACRSS